MAEYYLDEEGQIYADIAFRLGKIIQQYGEKIEKDDNFNFDSTLCICALQNLLTIFIEKFDRGNGYPITRQDNFFNQKTEIKDENFLSIKESYVIENTFLNGKNNVIEFITHLRNSLSHPTNIQKDSVLTSTGYYAQKDDFDKIFNYVFVDSPDMKNRRPKMFDSIERLNEYSKKAHNYSFDYEFLDGKYIIKNPRIYKISLSTAQLKQLTIKLSTILAQPVQKHWNGLIFNENILENAA